MSTPTTPEDELDDIFRRKIGEPHIEFNPEAWQAMEKKLAGASSDNRAFWRRFSILGLLGIFLVGGIVWYDFQPKSTIHPNEKAPTGSVALQQDTQAKNNSKTPSVGSFATLKAEQQGKVEQSGLSQDKVEQGRLDEHPANTQVALPDSEIPEASTTATGKVEADKDRLSEVDSKNLNKVAIDKNKLTVAATKVISNAAKTGKEKRVIAGSDKAQNGKNNLSTNRLVVPVAPAAKDQMQSRRDEKSKVSQDAEQISLLTPTSKRRTNTPVNRENLGKNRQKQSSGKATLDGSVETNDAAENAQELAKVADKDEKYDKASSLHYPLKKTPKSSIRNTPLAEKFEGNNGISTTQSKSKDAQASLQTKRNTPANRDKQRGLTESNAEESAKHRALAYMTKVPLSGASPVVVEQEQLQPIEPHYIAGAFLSDGSIAGPTVEHTNQLDAIVDSIHALQVASDSLAKPVVVDTNTVRLAVTRRKARWSVTLVVAPDFSVVSTGKISTPGFTTGFGISYQLSEKWSVSTGALYSNKIYSAKGDQYHVPAGYWGRWAPPEKIEGTCKVLDVPISLRYDFMQTQHLRYYAVVGISSYVMLREKYSYEYVYYGKTQEKSWDVVNKNKHFLKVANLSVGYERNLNKRFSYQVEPYLKVPLAGVGAGKVKLLSAGAFLSVRYRFSKL